MANFICEFEGVRGRNLKLYDTKIIITTKLAASSLITGNFTDGEKTIYLCDVVGVQFKRSGDLIGYLQFETSSIQMNNQSNNMYSENTFTYKDGKNRITNKLMEAVYAFITNRIEEIKYDVTLINTIPDFESMKICEVNVSDSDDKYDDDSTIKEFSEPLTGLKCEMCDEHFEHLTYCKIKDDMGTRYRNICDDCIQKLNATKQ